MADNLLAPGMSLGKLADIVNLPVDHQPLLPALPAPVVDPDLFPGEKLWEGWNFSCPLLAGTSLWSHSVLGFSSAGVVSKSILASPVIQPRSKPLPALPRAGWFSSPKHTLPKLPPLADSGTHPWGKALLLLVLSELPLQGLAALLNANRNYERNLGRYL